MKDFDAVVFDMDGVIFDSERAWMDCWLEVAGKYGIEGLEGPYLACTGTTMARTREIMLEAYGEDFPYDRYAKEAADIFYQKYDGDKLPVKAGVTEILEFLRNHQKKIALATSTRREIVVEELRTAGILDYFDEIVTGDMVKNSKPAPDIFLLACEKIGVAPEQVYAIEDSFNGIRAAANGKLRPIMVPDLRQPDEEIRNLAEAVLENLTEVIRYLR